MSWNADNVFWVNPVKIERRQAQRAVSPAHKVKHVKLRLGGQPNDPWFPIANGPFLVGTPGGIWRILQFSDTSV